VIEKDHYFHSGAISCEKLSEEWFLWLKSITARKPDILTLAGKGSKRVFDVECLWCDEARSKRARKDWQKKMSVPMDSIDSDLRDRLKQHVRRVMGKRWWKDYRSKEERFPDQQGCLELERKLGGSASVPRVGEEPEVLVKEASPCLGCCFRDPNRSRAAQCRRGDEGSVGLGCSDVWETIGEVAHHNEVRVGTAKTKGKFRVVTMQSARTKRILRPIHEAAYDHISKADWCVRGQVKSEHLEPLLEDKRPGETFISADFEAATDNLNPDAVLAVVETLCEGLPEVLGDVLLESFTGIHWTEYVEGRPPRIKPILRGSMMGNLLSFPILCLLNKFALSEAYRRRGMRGRKFRLNGDDLVFCGDNQLFGEWKKSTSELGFVVNESKTGCSLSKLELNSQDFSVENRRNQTYLRPTKKLNFGFLNFRFRPDDEGSGVFSLCDKLSYSSAIFVLTHPSVRMILANRPLAVSVVPKRWWHFLVRRSWFRGIIVSENRAPTEHRSLNYIEGPILKGTVAEREAAEVGILALEKHQMKVVAASWRGKAFSPPSESMLKWSRVPKKMEKRKDWVLRRGERKWVRMWIPEVLEIVESVCYELLSWDNTEVWADEQPGLRSKQVYSFKPPKDLVFPSPFAGIRLIGGDRVMFLEGD